jgi:hypothetical protein
MEQIDSPPGSLEICETRFDVRSKCNPGAHSLVDQIEESGVFSAAFGVGRLFQAKNILHIV